MEKSVIIIGAGMGGLAAGIYARKNGFDALILEAHSIAGGQCTSWTRKGYVFDACIHHLFGCSDTTGTNKLWRELGAMPLALLPTRECFAAQFPDGRTFIDYWDLEKLRGHMLELSPGDSRAIDAYIGAIRSLKGTDLMGGMTGGSFWRAAKGALGIAFNSRRLLANVKNFAARFKDQGLRRAVELSLYSLPEGPFLMHAMRHAYALDGDIKWPAGGSRSLASAMERRFLELGGRIEYKRKVERIIVEEDTAVGVVLADGSEWRADYLVSNADGRKTIRELLGGRYTSPEIDASCADPDDEVNWAVHVFLGVDMDLSAEPSDLIILLDGEVEIAGKRIRNMELQTFGHDPSMAPPGKGVIKAELFSTRSYWKALEGDRAAYEAEKKKVAEGVIGILEKRWPDFRGTIEAIDVPTLATWERYMGGTNGFNNMPKKDFSFMTLLKKPDMGLPGLRNFYFAGVWATSAPALFLNALSGKKVIREICKAEKRPFTS
jgi:phytoene dehydrogenase-like protein